MRRRKKIVPTRTPRETAIDSDDLPKIACHNERGVAGSPEQPELEVDVLPGRFHETVSHITELRDLVRRLRTNK
jgi:hypothetical protein